MRTASTDPDGIGLAPPDVGALEVTLAGTVLQTVPLGQRVVTIGRLPGNAVVLPDQSVSRQHAEVRLDASGPLLTDLGSAGGTTVDGEPVPAGQPVALAVGSRIGIGPYVLTCTAPPPPPAVVLAPPAPPAPPAARGGRKRASLAALDEAPLVVEARPTAPAARAEGPSSRYLQHLPAIFQDNDFLGRMLLIFETIWEPLEQRQDHFPLYFDPRTSPAAMLPWLAGWLELQLDPHWPEARRRALVAEAMELYRWRGTPYGMTRMLEVCTGLAPTITEDPSQPFTFRISIAVPPGRVVRREMIEELVRAHKPAHVGYVLEIVP